MDTVNNTIYFAIHAKQIIIPVEYCPTFLTKLIQFLVFLLALLEYLNINNQLPEQLLIK
jgi:hypothetical protein